MQIWKIELHTNLPDTIRSEGEIIKELDGREILLIHENEYKSLKKGRVIYSILGEKTEVGAPDVDFGTRGGYLAYGFLIDDRNFGRKDD